MPATSRNVRVPDAISSGSLYLDTTLGIGGFPRGVLSEIVGPPGSGKTILCYHLIAEAQKQGLPCLYIDCEHSLTLPFACTCGVDPDRLLISRPASAEEALEIVETLVRSGELPLAIIDSANSLASESGVQEAADSSGDVVLTALDSWRLRRLAASAKKANAAVLFTRQEQTPRPVIYHQLSDRLDQLSLSFLAALRMETKCLDTIRQNGITTGLKLQIRIIKNQFFPRPYTTVINLMYNEGTTKAGELFDLSSERLLIHRQNQGYFFQDQCLGKGRTEAIEFLRNNDSICGKIEQILRQQMILTRKVQTRD